MPPPDSVSPSGKIREFAAASWSGGDLDIAAVTGWVPRKIRVRTDGSDAVLVVTTAGESEPRTLTVDDNWQEVLLVVKIGQASTVTLVQVQT
jgi:hypothetical protein